MTLLGTLVGGAIAFCSAVYLHATNRRDAERAELQTAAAAFGATLDEIATIYERGTMERTTRAIVGVRDRETVSREFFAANARLLLVAPPAVYSAQRSLVQYMVRWRQELGPGGLEEWSRLRRAFTTATRGALARGAGS